MGRRKSSAVDVIAFVEFYRKRLQFHSRTCNPGTHGTDGASAYFGCFFVREPDDLGENEYFSSIGFKLLDKLAQRNVRTLVVTHGRSQIEQFVVHSTTALTASNLVETDVASDS